MKPNAIKHNPDPAYLRRLVALTGMTQADVARRIGIGGRSMRRHLAAPDATTFTPAPYVVQFAIEQLAGVNSDSQDSA